MVRIGRKDSSRDPIAARACLPPWPRGPIAGGAVVCALLACSLFGQLTATALAAEPAWTTYHRDPGRSGDDPDAIEPIAPLTAWQTPSLGAPIWGQPLVLGSRVYVATVGDEVYALNAVTGAVEWERSAGTPVPASELPCGDVEPTVGIVGTPVIDAKEQVLYAVADNWNANTGEARHLLKGFALSNGQEVLSAPVDPPSGDPKALLQRTALSLDEGNVVFGFGGNDGDCSDYRGALVAAPTSTGAARFWQVPIAPPSLWGGAVWAPSGPVVDGSTIYAATGNPVPPEGQMATTYDYSDSLVKLAPEDFTANPLSEPKGPLGYFKPLSWEQESNDDLDLASAGSELLPGGRLFQAGKDGVGYVVNEATMNSGAPPVFSHEVCGGNGSFGGDAYAAPTIFIACTNGTEALTYDETTGKFTSLWHGPADAFGPPIVSGGLVWVLATGGFNGGGEKLYGLSPATGSPIYTIALPSPIADHFGSPSAAGGRLFVATGCSVTAYEISQRPAGGLTAGISTTDAGCPPAPAPPGQAPSQNPGGPPAQGAASSAAGSSVPVSTPAPPPLLLQTQLHATAADKVAVKLRCAAASGSCAGSVTLDARFTQTSGRGGRRKRHVILIRLARASFRHARGDFIVTIALDSSAVAHLRAHGNRLAVQVAIASATGRVRVVSAVLT